MTIVISLAEGLDERVDVQRYGLCGVAIQTDVAVPWLQAFAGAGSEYPGLERPKELSLVGQPAWRRSITGVVAGIERRLEIGARADGLRIQVESVGEFFVSADGSQIRFVDGVTRVDRDVVMECVLGAPLALSLALLGRWFLHASAVVGRGRVVAFAGQSGIGKSTVAAQLSSTSGLERLADDLLGYGLQGDLPVAIGEFPQFKLTPDQQVIGPPRPLATVMLLVPADGNRRLSMRTLWGREKLLGFLNHGVATRAFPPPVLSKNLKIAAQLIENIDVIQVRYPKTRGALLALMRKVTDICGVPVV